MNRFVLSIGLIALCAFLAALATAANTPTNPILQGEFEDGAKLLWQCRPSAFGTVDIVFVSKTGQSYTASIKCGGNSI